MNIRKTIFPLILLMLVLSGCGSVSSVKKKGRAGNESGRLIPVLLAPPPVTELTASYSTTVQGTRISGQIRMRRDHSIQINANVLGLMEVGRIEFLPDRVVMTDRVHNLYSVCHYADIPYRNEIGLDFYMVEALFWNRLFSPGSDDIVGASARLKEGSPDINGNVPVTEMEYGYLFRTDGKSKLLSSVKSGKSYEVGIDYSDFRDVSAGYEFPGGMSINLRFPDTDLVLNLKLSQISVEKKNWPDMTQISSRMKKVTFEELIESLGL